MNTVPESQAASIVRNALKKIESLHSELAALNYAQREPIAIIGLSCRFPGADTPEEFWRLLSGGGDAIREIPADRWDASRYYDAVPATAGKMYTRRAGLLSRVDEFDPEFFRISLREAIYLDPQQRLLLELSWEALERAGVSGSRQSAQTGVFIGISECDYRDLIMHHGFYLEAYAGSGNTLSTASGRISYCLGLNGPNLALDTACSSSLVSVALAVKSLRLRECDLALAGGVQAQLAPDGFIRACQLRMLSPDGRCKTFDAAADGYVRAEGCGIVVLKRLSDALASKDNILAVVRGVAVNHDGYTSGLTVPSGPAQQAVIRQALKDGGVNPDQLSYIEAHGTGTSLGDPIEINALQEVFGQGTEPLVVGSVKTNIGHTEAAAGIAGLIKVVLSMQHGEIPGNLHFHNPSPLIDWAKAPVKVPTEPTPWLPGRLAGVSSFGFGGTNSHIVLEEAPRREPATDGATLAPRLLAISAKSPEALRELAHRYARHLDSEPETPLADLCFTAYTGRKHFSHRFAAVGESATELRLQLETFARSGGEGCALLPSLHEGRDERWQKLTSMGESYARGNAVDWEAVDGGAGRRIVTLPTYPFQRRRCWLPEPKSTPGPPTLTAAPLEALLSGDASSLFALLEDDPELTAEERASAPAILKRLVDLRQRLATTQSPPRIPEKRPEIWSLIRSQIESIMGSVPADDELLSDLGMDSLMAVELRNALRAATHVELPVALVFDHPTIERLAEFLLEKLASASAAAKSVHSGCETSFARALSHSPASAPLCLPPWTVRPAVMADVARLSELEREAYGWIGEDAIAPPELIADRIVLLNSSDTPWFWVLERDGEIGAWQVLQPTSVDPSQYGSWAEATDNGTLRATYDPNGPNVYIVAGGAVKRFPSVASHLITLHSLSMLRKTGRNTMFVCLAMPGYAKYFAETAKAPEEYIAQVDGQGIPLDEFIGLCVYDWPVLPSFRVLRNGYPPDRDSCGHGVSTVLHLNDIDAAIEETYQRILRHADTLGIERNR